MMIGQKKVYQAESFEAELKKDSCCCGATVENPCLCMEEGVMNCSAVEPKCPCYAAKDAESFEAEDVEDSAWDDTFVLSGDYVKDMEGVVGEGIYQRVWYMRDDEEDDVCYVCQGNTDKMCMVVFALSDDIEALMDGEVEPSKTGEYFLCEKHIPLPFQDDAKYGAESFDAEGLLFDDGGERYGQGFITTNEEIYKERLIQYVLESVFAEYYTPTEEEVAEGYPEVWGETFEEQEAANNQLQQWLSGKSIDELTSLAGGYARTKDVDLDKGWVEMWGNRKGLETDYYRGRHAESFDAEDLNYPCQICGEQAIYNFQDSTLRWDIVNDEDLNNLKYAGWSGENQNDFYCKKHANQYESGDFYKFNSEGESFEAERKPNQCMHCNEVLYEIEVWEDFRCPHCNNSIGDIYSDKISYDDYMSAESFGAENTLCQRCGVEYAEAIKPMSLCRDCYIYYAESFEADSEESNVLRQIKEIIHDPSDLNTHEAFERIKYLMEEHGFATESFEADSEESNVLRKIKEIIHDPSDLNTHEAFERIKYLMEEHGFATESFGAEDNYKLGNYADYEILELDTHSYLMSVGHSESEAEDLIERYEAFIEVGFENGDSPYEIGISITENERLDNEAESFEAPGEMEEEDFTPVDITQCHVCARPYEYSRIARALVQHYLKESKDGTRGWKTKGNPDGTRRTVRNIAGYQLYWFGLGALENYMEEGKISKMTPNIIELLRTAIVPNIIAGDVVQFIESMEIEDIEDTDPKFFTDFSDTWEAPDDRLRPERPSDDSGDRRKYRKKPKKPWRAETDPSE